MRKVIENLKNIPVALSGLALGVAGLGNLLATEIHPYFRLLALSAAMVLLTLLFIKNLLHPKVFIAEAIHPVSGSFIPTFDMTLMLIASGIGQYSLLTGQVLWYIAFIFHIAFAINFTYQSSRYFSINKILPSYFVPFVGIVVACISGVNLELAIDGQIIFYIGFTLYLMLLPLVMYRLLFGDRISDNQLPAFAVIGAPASLCLYGYLSVFNQPHYLFVTMLFGLALFMNSLMILSLIRVNPYRLKFMPIYASFTFPLVIGATGLIKYGQFIGTEIYFGKLWYILGCCEIILAVVVVMWVTWKMIKFVKDGIFLP